MARFDRQQYIYNLIERYGKLKRDDILIALPKCSENIVSYYLDELVQIGLVARKNDFYEKVS